MAPFKSGKGRNLGKIVEVFRSSNIGQGIAAEPKTEATGGTVVQTSTHKYHVFHPNTGQPNVFTVTSTITAPGSPMKILVIGGGGSGAGPYVGGGGGAGGVWHGDNVNIAAGSYPVSIGAGAEPATTPGYPGQRGGTTTFATPGYTVTSTGGGGGNQAYYAHEPTGIRDGGSGGGGGVQYAQPGAGGSPISNGPYPGWVFYGNAGGAGGPYSPYYDSGGGGGAGSQGTAGTTSGGGNGGAGQAFPDFPGPEIAPAIPTTTHNGYARTNPERTEFINAVGPTGLFAGGGGGGRIPEAVAPAPGGTGGGGKSSVYASPPSNGDPAAGAPGVNYTGSGGGANSQTINGSYPDYVSRGGTGVVIIKYEYS